MPRDEYLITIPAGDYPKGSVLGGDAANENEHWPDGKVGSVSLDAFRLSFAPVTNAEFACFVDAGGYDDARWWEGADAERWLWGEYENTESQMHWRRFWHDAQEDAAKALARHSPNATEYWKETSYKKLLGWSEAELEDWIKGAFGAKQHRIPGFWDDPSFSSATQPVVGVSWFEASAYCAWLSAQTGQMFCLPTECQWEAAARGPAASGHTGRLWAWGNSEPTHWQMNAEPAQLRKTTPVGVFVNADTPEGVCDMAGNVLEWCATKYDRYSSTIEVDEKEQTASERRVLRGGSWIFDAQRCRSANREGSGPSDRDRDVGFRIAQVTTAPAGAERPTSSQ